VLIKWVFGAFIFCTLFLPLATRADVFRCQVGDKVLYQQVPCASSGQKIKSAPASSFGGRADDPVGEMRRIEQERERRRDLADADRRNDEAVVRQKKLNCSDLQSRADRYREHERSAHKDSTRDWYGAERRAAEARYDRECR